MRSLFLSIIFSLVFSMGLSHASECDSQEFLRELLFDSDPGLTYARSDWGESVELKAMQGTHRRYRYLHTSKPLMKVFSGSIAETSPELIHVLDDLNQLQLRPKSFKHEFQRIHRSPPELDDFKDFYLGRSEIYNSGMREFIERLDHSSPALASRVKRNHLEQTIERDQLVDLIKNARNENEVVSKATAMNNLMSGALTELQATVSLSGVQTMGLRLEAMKDIKQTIAKRAEQALNQLNASPTGLQRLTASYPHIFKNPRVIHLHERAHAVRMERIQEWIESKEIDVIRQVDGKTRWVEVKHNHDAFTLDRFKDGTAHKSPFDQIIEDKEIIEFLRLSDKIELEYLATGGMSDEVKTLLEQNGVKVILAH
jgi:hypothetical protein